jgi:hypothetical protein
MEAIMANSREKLRWAIEGIISVALETDYERAIEEFVEQVVTADLLIHVDKPALEEHVRAWFEPNELYTYEELYAWAKDNLSDAEAQEIISGW